MKLFVGRIVQWARVRYNAYQWQQHEKRRAEVRRFLDL